MTYLLTSKSAHDAGAEDERIATLIPPGGLTLRQVAALDVTAEDRLWALCHAVGAPARVLRLFAVRLARESLARESLVLSHVPDLLNTPARESITSGCDVAEITSACDVAERYAEGQATCSELLAANDSLTSAPWRSAGAVAYAATLIEEWDAVYGATRAASLVLLDATWDSQIEKLIEMLESEEKYK